MAGLSFLYPWLLAVLALVPALWLILRVTPPRPQVVRFPAFFLLRDLDVASKAPARTPWWLLLLRCLLVVTIILAMAEPVSRMQSALPGGDAPVMLVIDNGWAAAVNWDKRVTRMREILAPLQRGTRNVYILPTAAAADKGAPALIGPLTAAAALETAGGLQPHAWPAQHDAVTDLLAAWPNVQKPGHVVFLSDGSARSALDAQEMVKVLSDLSGGAVAIVNDDTVNRPVLLRRLDDAPGQLVFEVELLKSRTQQTNVMLVALSDNGTLIDDVRFAIKVGDKKARLEWLMEEGLRDKVARIALRDPQMASTVYLTDTQWRQRPIGVLADGGQRDNASFLNEVYYLRRALEVDSTLVIDSLDMLLAKQRAVLIWADSAPLNAAERVKLLDWVNAGGLLIRFAGPALAANPEDALLPVSLRQGQRAMEGAMTWEKPATLGVIPEQSPLYGLDTPPDVTVTRQLLASPDPETFSRTWLQLSDGTPLITGGAVGKGAIALIHTTAGPDWSNFCYSGLYVDTLRRMVALSRGISDYRAALMLAPLQVMDAYGHLRPPASSSIVGMIDMNATYEPSSRTPPGIYGDSQQFQVFTLGQSLSGLYPLPSMATPVTYASYGATGESNYKPLLLKIALLLLLADLIATLVLRGFVRIPQMVRAGRTVAFALFVFALAVATPALAQEDAAQPSDSLCASSIYFAYVETGDATVDQISRNGLDTLARIVSVRTSIRVRGVVGVDPEVDTLYTYPFIYWPVTATQRPLSLSAAQAVQSYMSRGGMIVFDTRDLRFGNVDGQTVGVERLRSLTQSLQVPALTEVASGHILGKSFYLLDAFPGLYAGGKLWVEKDPNPHYDAVTSVIIGGNDWAAAWSDHPTDRARLPVEPGGERQREMALRFGVNLVMVSLAGNYKADQVHVPFILERMGQ